MRHISGRHYDLFRVAMIFIEIIIDEDLLLVLDTPYRKIIIIVHRYHHRWLHLSHLDLVTIFYFIALFMIDTHTKTISIHELTYTFMEFRKYPLQICCGNDLLTYLSK